MSFPAPPRKLNGVVLGRDLYDPAIWVIRRDGEAVRRGKGKLWARWWLAWERRRAKP